MSHSLNTKQALLNVSTQAGSCKTSALMLTASLAMALSAYGEERTEEANTAIRATLISSGFVKIVKDTKQPSDKARNYMKAAQAAYTNYAAKINAFIAQEKDVTDNTADIATFFASFALSGNHYEGGVYLMPLTLGLSKKACKERIASKDADNQEADESEVTKLPAKGKAARATTSEESDDNEAVEALETIASASGVLSAIRSMVKVKAGSKPSVQASNSVVKLFHDLDTIARILRGEKVKASKEVASLAVNVAIHFANVKQAAKKAAKAKDVASIAKAA